MNTPIAIAFVLNSLAVVAHLIGGTKETLSIAPSKHAAEDLDVGLANRLNRNWMQATCAFQMLSVDLLLVSILLYLLAFTDTLSPARTFGFALSALFFVWGVVWLVQLLALKSKPRELLLLGHWMFWFVCSGLVYWGTLAL